jgi:competence ComEA-like helix-hairpin-helix protein
MSKTSWFSVREVRALLWLLPVLAVASWLVWEASRPRRENLLPTTETTPSLRDTPPQEGNRLAPSNDDDRSLGNKNGDKELSAFNFQLSTFEFDPNTVEFHDLMRLGFSRGEALGIVKYRERGKVFEIPEDFAACYQVSEEMFRRLRPYIRIGEQFRLKQFDWAEAREDKPDVASQSTTTESNTTNVENSNEQSLSTFNFQLSTLIELNSADSAALIAISGIGPKTLVSIMDYRRRLGGFARVEQLAEVAGVTEQNYERIVPQIFVDTLAIQKININFADAKLLGQHPYIQGDELRKLLKLRQLKGGWSNTGQLVEDKIFTPAEAEKLAPYLLFGQSPQ